MIRRFIFNVGIDCIGLSAASVWSGEADFERLVAEATATIGKVLHGESDCSLKTMWFAYFDAGFYLADVPTSKLELVCRPS